MFQGLCCFYNSMFASLFLILYLTFRLWTFLVRAFPYCFMYCFMYCLQYNCHSPSMLSFYIVPRKIELLHKWVIIMSIKLYTDSIYLIQTFILSYHSSCMDLFIDAALTLACTHIWFAFILHIYCTLLLLLIFFTVLNNMLWWIIIMHQ